MIPRTQIRWVVERLHVGTPDLTIRREVYDRIRKHLKRGGTLPTPSGVEIPVRRVALAALRYAVACHHENQKLYFQVMRGGI